MSVRWFVVGWLVRWLVGWLVGRLVDLSVTICQNCLKVPIGVLVLHHSSLTLPDTTVKVCSSLAHTGDVASVKGK